MATELSAAMSAMYLDTRPGIHTTRPTKVYDGLVSELAVNDWLVGSRQLVTAVGATASGIRQVTLLRSNGVTVVLPMVAASGIRFAR